MTTLKQLFTLVLFFNVTLIGKSQEIIAGPYLQDADPTSINIMWETSTGGESVVLWGESKEKTNKSVNAVSFINKRPSEIHRVSLKGLEPSKTYYYQVKTANVKSAVYHFTTPPQPDEQKPFKLVAMSDMQRDDAHPDKFKELVEVGVIPYLNKETKNEDIFNDLGMIIIPGDLVKDGLEYTDWTNDFFRQSKALLPYVPVYPVLGNHERNSEFYFNYFHLPENGTPGYLEHWWYKDYANVRIIGLNSNKNYRIIEQLDWLDDVLEKTANDDNIDFVFAQLHHPHKSELWIDGELDYTGEVIYRLEQFSSRTGKPTIHFYGHTHGYSRGQSQDHTHLWVNVATAGGKIDGWGEYVQKNYDEFSVSRSDYGFVLMEIQDGDNPRFKLIRVSRGDIKNPKDNVVNDIVEIKRYGTFPETPLCISPVNEKKVNAEIVVLKASPFKSSDNSSEHGETQWQIARTDNFTNPDVDIRKNFEDWYGGVNLQEGANLTQQKTTALKSGTEYFWRVRYRTKGLEWSSWSEVQKFSTK